MEKEKKGLFGRLLDFWKEKTELGSADGIGFWNDADDVEKHFAEMGAVVSMTQEETKKTFWGGMAEREQEMQKMASEVEDAADAVQRKRIFAEPEQEREAAGTGLFVSSAALQERGLMQTFFMEMPEKKEKRDSVLAVAEPVVQETGVSMEADDRSYALEVNEKEEPKAEPAVDIEKLMRQMTKMLWEERESCGRRLR